MRLIDAEALINEWNGLIKLMATNSDGVVPVDFGAVIGAVSKAPTVDAVEVVHGRWIKKTADCIYYYACSECGEPVLRSQWGCDFFSKFCPNCGAKMDGEGKSE